MPEAEAGDPIVILLDALEKASADPEIKNFVIDISNNQGGSVDLVVAAQSLLLGSSENAIPVENTLTGQKIALSYDVDRNFNGAFDDADDKVHYDFRYAVLVSDSTFSCGNLFASVMKDHGVLILGERSGGGTCAIQNMATADGFMYRISSGRMRLINEAGEALEEGIAPDVEVKLPDILTSTYADFGEDESYAPDSVSDRVAEMEKCLQYLGYDVDRTDGYFSDAAEAALLQFASDHELESDGTLNQTMYNALLTDVVSLWLSDETRDTQLMKGIELLNGSEDTAAVRQRSARC